MTEAEFFHNSYFYLFNQITDALQAMDKQNFGTAKDVLKKAQKKNRNRVSESSRSRKRYPRSVKNYGFACFIVCCFADSAESTGAVNAGTVKTVPYNSFRLRTRRGEYRSPVLPHNLLCR